MTAQVVTLFPATHEIDVSERDQLIEQLNLRFSELRGDLNRRLDDVQGTIDDTQSSMRSIAHDQQSGELARERIESQLTSLNGSVLLLADTALVAQLRSDFDAHLLMHTETGRETSKKQWDVRLALIAASFGLMGTALFEGIKWFASK